MDPREKKLPKWAQDELRHLRMRLDEHQKREADEKAKHSGSEVSIIRGLDEIPLPAGATIRFKFRDYMKGLTGMIDVQLQNRCSGEEYLDIRGGDRCSIEPAASNRFFVRVCK